MLDKKVIRERAIEFLGDSNNYATYSDDLRSIGALFIYVYADTPLRPRSMCFCDNEFIFKEFYDGEIDKPFKNNHEAHVNDFIKNASKRLGLSCIHSIDGCYLMFGEFGMITMSFSTKTGLIKRIKVWFLPNFSEESKVLRETVECLEVKECSEKEKNHYSIAYVDDGVIETMESEFDDWETDIKRNYNDDVPYDKMNEEINNNSPSLILLYGEPGTGKSSIIKSLINENLNKEFIYIDSSLFTSLSNGQFLSFLNDHKGDVFILEDCEKALAKRSDHHNESINTILNITDGIIAESLKCKFICTFNCSDDDIDEALLRKGRLSIMYEFRKLSLDKARAICPNVDEEMTLADLYNIETKNRFNKEEKPKQKKIGF